MTKQEQVRQAALKRAKKATPDQQTFLAILLNDCGFGERIQRNAFLSSELDREIKFLDDLTVPEASSMIQQLAKRRNEMWNADRMDEDAEEGD